jgi:hypothetical protein
MGETSIANLVALIVAVLGALGGLAAFLKVTSDNARSVGEGAKSVSDGAKTVVDLMNERITSNEGRLDSLEDYVVHFDVWADRLLDILDRAITMLPDALRTQFESEATKIKTTRPKRPHLGKGAE